MSRFYEPIILKKDSSLEKSLEQLKQSSKPNKNDLYMLEMGIKGEQQVEYHLTKSNIGMYILRDVNLEVDDMTAQIDFVVITSHHCYFIECKNYSTNKIIVDENRNFEINRRYKNTYRRQGIKSPLSQVDDQLNVFKRICLKNTETVKQLLEKTSFKDYFKTMVVFTNPDNILDLKKTPYDIKYRILKADNLVRQIEYDENHYKGNKLSQEEMKRIADFILLNNVEVKKIVIPPQPDYIDNYSEEMNTVQSKRSSKRIIKILMVIFALSFIYYYYEQGKVQTPTKKDVYLTSEQISALNELKTAYKNSQTNGFDIIHGEACSSISSIFGTSGFSCTKYPLEVNYISENELTIYKNYNCYSLSYSGNKITKSNIQNLMMSGNSTCTGIHVGYTNIDENNEYCKKIGGFETIKELAVYTYVNNKSPLVYYDFSHIEERGGAKNLGTTYMISVNQYMCGLTGKTGIGASSIGKEQSNKMCEYYYYIGK